MRTFWILAVGLGFVFADRVVARAQEEDAALIDDVSPPKIESPLIDDLAPSKKLSKGVNQEDSSKPAKSPKKTLGRAGEAEPLAEKLPATLSDALTKALRSNPEVLLAEAELQKVQAEYRQAQLRAIQEVTVTFRQRELQQGELSDCEEANKRVPGSNPDREIQRLKHALAETDARLAYLLGIGAGLPEQESAAREETHNPSLDAALDQYAAAKTKQPEIPEKFRELLRKPIRLKFDSRQLSDVFESLKSQTSGELRILMGMNAPTTFVPFDEENEAPLQSVLEMIADKTGGGFVIRDYGLLFIQGNVAIQYQNAATIPEDLRVRAGMGGGF